MPVVDVVDDQDFDEPPPPGLDESYVYADPSQIIKYRPSKSDEFVSKMGEFVSLAMFRQKLHKDVLGKWRSTVFSSSLHQCFTTWRASQNPSAIAIADVSAHAIFISLSLLLMHYRHAVYLIFPM